MPVDELALDGVKFFESAVNPFRRCKRCVNIFCVNTISNQSPFKVNSSILLNAALAREFGKIEEVIDGRRTFSQL